MEERTENVVRNWYGMRSEYEKTKQICYKILDIAKANGINLLIGAEILIKEFPGGLAESDAIHFLGGWILNPENREKGRRNYLGQSKGSRSRSSEARTGFPPGWAPEGMMPCPNGCTDGSFRYGERGTDSWVVVGCTTCGGEGYLNKDGSQVYLTREKP